MFYGTLVDLDSPAGLGTLVCLGSFDWIGTLG